MPLCPQTGKPQQSTWHCIRSTGRYRDSLQQVVNNLGIDLRDLGRSEEEITNELDRLLSADDD